MTAKKLCGIEITPETNRVGWGGEPLDLVWIVDGILQDERESRNASSLNTASTQSATR